MNYITLTHQEGKDIIDYKTKGVYPNYNEEDKVKLKALKKKLRDRAKLFEYSFDRNELLYVDKYHIKYKFFYLDRPLDKWAFVDQVHATGHMGRDRLYDLVSQEAYGIHRDVCATVVRNCRYCQLRNNLITKPGYTPIVPTLPRERVIVDLVNLSEERAQNDGYCYLFVAVDSFSKFAITFPLKKRSAVEVGKCFQKLIYTYGAPFIIHTDNGTEFKNSIVENILNNHDIKFVHGLPRYPQSQGQVERLNQTLKNSLSDTARSDGVYPRWIDILDRVVFTYNSVKHGTTGLVPFDVFFGDLKRELPADTKQSIEAEMKYYVNGGIVEEVEEVNWENDESIIDVPEEYLQYLVHKDNVNKEVKNNIIKLGKYEAKRRKWKNDRDVLEIGDRILRLVYTDNNTKTRKQALNGHKDYDSYVILNIEDHKAHIKNEVTKEEYLGINLHLLRKL